MSHKDATLRARTAPTAPRRTFGSWIAGITAGSLVASALIVVGVGVQQAAAAPDAPQVTAGVNDSPLVAGADGQITANFSNKQVTAAGEYNLSVGLVLPEGVDVVDYGAALGAPTKTYTHADNPLPGAYSMSAAQCEALGLEASPTAQKCRVPQGMQYSVFMNISDLPSGASNGATVTVRPDAALFEPGSKIPFSFAGFTSNNANLIPVFPGSTSVATAAAHTSAPGVPSAKTTIPVEALRVAKAELTSPENELLRGVHRNQATYRITIDHTGQGDITDTEIVDFLPAGLEYLGDGSVDNTQNSGGIAGQTEEYPGAGSLVVGTQPPANYAPAKSVLTLQADAALVAKYPQLTVGEYYTMVTWDLPTLLASAGKAQNFPAAAGTTGQTVIEYLAGIPLFENRPFDDAAATALGELGQTANLDNNTGPSTRHGADQAPWSSERLAAKGLTNRAYVHGDYTLQHPSDPTNPVYRSVASGTETVFASDVRIVKSVDNGGFEQGNVVKYHLDLATSEYVDAELGDLDPSEGSASIRPNRLTDDMGDGICPVLPWNVPVTPGASTAAPEALGPNGEVVEIPNLVIGDPRTGRDGSNEYGLSTAEWATKLGSSAADCDWPSTKPGVALTSTTAGDPLPAGVTLTGIAFDPADGHFYLDFGIGNMAANSTARISYTASQNSAYLGEGGTTGGTSSGDVVRNSADVVLTTTPTAATADVKNASGVEVGGAWKAEDDSHAVVRATTSEMTKSVLPRSAGAVKPADIAAVPTSKWEDVRATEPFIAGDEVWYRIYLKPPTRTEVRNPKLTDFLPAGTTLAGTTLDSSNYVVVPPTGLPTVGSCAAPVDAAAWTSKFIGTPTVSGNRIEWNLGSNGCVPGNTDDRFLPTNSTITFFIKAKVVDTTKFGTVDLPQNLAKYQQQGRVGEDDLEIFFKRDDAEIQVVTAPQLVKGIARNSFAGITTPAGSVGAATGTVTNCAGVSANLPNYPAGSGQTALNPFGSNCDGGQGGAGEFAVQGDGVTFRVDVTAPQGNAEATVDTENYVVWDALPVGIHRADVSDLRATSMLNQWVETETAPVSKWEQLAVETPIPAAQLETSVVDPGDAGYPSNVSAAYAGRSLVIAKVKAKIPGSQLADPQDPHSGVVSGFSLLYTVTVPAGASSNDADKALLGRDYKNTASIVQYEAASQRVGSTGSVLVPVGDDSMRQNGTAEQVAASGAYVVPTTGTIDSSGFSVPGAAMQKKLVKTEIAPTGTAVTDSRNAANQIVQGEYATYDVSVRVPAHTTVREGVLADLGRLVGQGTGTMTPNSSTYQLKSAQFVDAAGAAIQPPAGFAFDTTTGKLTFPSYYTAGATAETFTVRLVLWTQDVDATNTASSATRPQIPNSKVLRNTAEFTSKTVAGTAAPKISANADVTYVEPNPTLAKAVSGTQGANGEVEFTLTAGNGNGRPALYDAVVYDCLPIGFALVAGSFVPSGTTTVDPVDTGVKCSVTGSGANVRVKPADANGTGTLIKWNVGRIDAGNAPTLKFKAVVDPAAGGGGSYTNSAHIVGYTLPATVGGDDATARRGDRMTGAQATANVPNAGLTKSVSPTQTPVGGVVTYTLATTIPAYANYYDAKLVDTLPAGVEFIPGTVNITFTGGPTIPVDPKVSGSASTGQTLQWPTSDAGFDIPTTATPRTIQLTFQAKVTKSVKAAAPNNSATFTWNTVKGDNSTKKSTTANAAVTILNPVVGIEKKIDTATPVARDAISVNPDAAFKYQLRVYQPSSGNTPAHHITVEDVVPAGVRVDTSTFTIDGVTATAAQVTAEAGVAAGTGGKITWTLAGPLHQQAGAGTPKQILLGYSAAFTDSTGLSAKAYRNVVDVKRYESFGDGGWVYEPGKAGSRIPGGTSDIARASDAADATPLFPSVSPVKTVTRPVAGQNYGLAYVGQDFNWTLTLTNRGAGVANSLNVVDTLPQNWSFKAGSARLGGVALADPSAAQVGGKTQLTWSADQLKAAVANALPLAAGGSLTITYDAIPGEAAIESPGTGLPTGGAQHTNTVSVTGVTDAQGNTRNATSTSYAGADSSATAYIAEADLQLAKTPIGGVIDAGAPGTPDNLHGLATGAWVPGQGIVSGSYAQPQWKIEVTNWGPDAGYGPFKIVDTQTLPTGVTVSGWTARLYPAGGGAAVNLGQVTGAGTKADPFIVGSGATSLNVSTAAKPGDRIELLGNVMIAAGATATGSELSNTASVEGATFERESKKTGTHPNSDTAEKELTQVADLAIDKQVTTTAATGGAGKPINWTLQVTNNGPSVSVNGTQKITVSDEIPAGVIGVANPSNASWTATTSGAGWPAKAGDTITWTYTGSAIAPGQTVSSITLSGLIDPAHEHSVTNIATVTPGDTPDQTTTNNTSEALFEFDSRTEISVDKTRVVQDTSGEWVAAGSLNPVPAPVPGENISYRITVTNHGPAVARGVNVTDALPSYLSFVSKTDVVGAWSTSNVVGDRALTMNLDTPAPLASPVGLATGDTSNVVSFILTTKLDPNFVLDSDAAVVNTAVAHASNADDDDDTDSSAAPSRDARLSIVKTHSGTPIAGTAIPYTITVTNDGPSASRGPISVTDSLPAGLSYVANTATISVAGLPAVAASPALSNEDRTLTWSVGSAADSFTLPVGESIVVSLNVLIDSGIANGNYVNTARVSGPDGPDASTTDTVTVERAADMSVVKQVADPSGAWVDETTAVAGETVSYKLTVENRGPSANPANLVDVMPTHLTLVSVTPADATAGWDCSASQPGTQRAVCANPFLAVGTTEIIVVAALDSGAVAGAQGQTAEFVNTATLTWIDRTTVDPDAPHESSDTAKIVASAEADLVLQKRAWDGAADDWADTAAASAGEQTRFRIDVRNDGPSDVIAPLTVTDVLPAGVTFGALTGDDTLAFWEASAAQVDPTTGEQVVTFTARDASVGLATGEALPELVYTVNVAADVASETALVNLAEVTSGTTERDTDNNRDSAQIEVARTADLAIAKTHDAAAVKVGDELPFSLVVTNNGPAVSSGAVVTDTVPAGLTVTSEPGALDSGWVIDSVTEQADGTTSVVASYQAELQPGEQAPPLVIVTTVEAAAYPEVVNTAAVAPFDPRETDPEPKNDTASDRVEVPPLVTLVTAKNVKSVLEIGKVARYEISVKNIGPTADPGPIVVTDALPRGLIFDSSPDAGVRVQNNVVTWTLDRGLAVGEQVKVSVFVKVTQEAYPEVRNLGKVSSSSELTPDSKVTDGATATVKQAPGGLTATGADFAALGVLAALLLVLGGAALGLTRKRRMAEPGNSR